MRNLVGAPDRREHSEPSLDRAAFASRMETVTPSVAVDGAGTVWGVGRLPLYDELLHQHLVYSNPPTVHWSEVGAFPSTLPPERSTHFIPIGIDAPRNSAVTPHMSRFNYYFTPASSVPTRLADCVAHFVAQRRSHLNPPVSGWPGRMHYHG